MEGQPRKYGSLTLYRRLILEARPYWPHIVGYLLLSLLATPLALLAPVPLKIAVDNVIGSRPLPRAMQVMLPAAWQQSDASLLFLVAMLVVVIALLTLAHKLAVEMLKTFLGERLTIGFRSRLFRHVQQLSLSYHDRRGTSDSTYRIQYDAPAIQMVMIDSVVPLVSAVAMLVGMLYVTFRLSPRLALVALAVCPPLMAMTGLFRRRLRSQWRHVKGLESSAQSIVQEVLGAVRVVKAFTRERHEHARFEQESRNGTEARLRASFQENLYAMLAGLIIAAGTAGALVVGIGNVKAGTLLLGDLIMVMAYIGKLYEPVRTLGKQLATREKSLASAERAFGLLDEAIEVPERSDAMPLVRARGAVSFRDVSFGYEGGTSVLDHLSIEIPAGTRVGIAGKTGAGKTTLINLLCRFYDPISGQVLLDSADLRDYRLADLRNQFAMVLQEPVLFSTTIAENIAYGRLGASFEEVVQAAKAANAHEFIEALPDGYQTQVGERGMCLSGGERQRISLARAFLKDAPILILDEPTSSVDLKTEAQIMEAMERLICGRTSFMIAHRPASLQNCEMLLRIENGRVVEAPIAIAGRPVSVAEGAMAS
ncbi:MAG TPA: ABC transporter ATP-binding protein [Tepidisphaeraceae bacterium]|jgi:ATP-binding cassette subfamily B protein|nr:ABC transporter ATP-binding protein [Tepidisphaeraceae bacterium]